MKNRIRELRFKNGLTLDDVFVKTKIWPSRLSRIEREVFKPSFREKKLISKVLKSPIKKVFPEHR